MKSKNKLKNKRSKIKNPKSINHLKAIKSKIILNKIISNLLKNISLNVIKYNKLLQKRLNIDINDYKEIQMKK